MKIFYKLTTMLHQQENLCDISNTTLLHLGLVIVFENDRLTIVFCFVKRSFLRTIISFSQKKDRF